MSGISLAIRYLSSLTVSTSIFARFLPSKPSGSPTVYHAPLLQSSITQTSSYLCSSSCLRAFTAHPHSTFPVTHTWLTLSLPRSSYLFCHLLGHFLVKSSNASISCPAAGPSIRILPSLATPYFHFFPPGTSSRKLTSWYRRDSFPDRNDELYFSKTPGGLSYILY